MGISKVLDDKNKPTSKSDTVECMKNITDCTFISSNGKCSAEWCIFNELPKMMIIEKTIKCIICGTPKTISVYNCQAEYICDECKNALKELMRNERE